MSFMKTISNILNERLKDKNLAEVARKISVSKTILHDWYTGRRIPSLKNIAALKKLADILGMDLEDLLLGESNERIISSVIFDDEKRRYQINIKKIR